MILLILLLLVYAAFAYFSFFILREIVGIKRLNFFFAFFYVGEGFISLLITHPLYAWPIKLGLVALFLLCARGIWRKRRWGYFIGFLANFSAAILTVFIAFQTTKAVLASCQGFGCLETAPPILSALVILVVIGLPNPFLFLALKGKEGISQNTP